MLLFNELQQANITSESQMPVVCWLLPQKNGPQEVSLDKCVAFPILYNVNFLYFVSVTHISELC